MSRERKRRQFSDLQQENAELSESLERAVAETHASAEQTKHMRDIMRKLEEENYRLRQWVDHLYYQQGNPQEKRQMRYENADFEAHGGGPPPFDHDSRPRAAQIARTISQCSGATQASYPNATNHNINNQNNNNA